MSTHDIRQYGGLGNGLADERGAFSAAAARCATDGGGTILVPAGTWRTGSVRLPSRTTLRLQAGATLLGSRDVAHYPLREQHWEGRAARCPDALVWSADAEDVAIVGEGVIDGQGEDWWAAVRAGKPVLRPRLVSFQNCLRVKLAGVRLTRSPSWTVHPWRCRDVRIEGVTILNPPHAPNTDGIDPESCQDVHITGCVIDVGDDAVVLKAGSSETGEAGFPPCRGVTIADCTMLHGHGGVVIGSEMSGGVRDVTVSNCTMRGTERGIRIKTRRGRGGAVERLSVRNVTMHEVGCPVVMHMYYRYTGLRPADVPWVSSRQPQPVDARTPVIRDIRLEGITATDVTGPCLGFLYGLPEQPIANVAMLDCRLSHSPQPDPAQAEPAMMVHIGPGEYPTCGLYLADVKGLSLKNVQLYPRAGEPLVTERVQWAENSQAL